MKIPIALLRGAILGLMVVGAIYFLQSSYGPVQDALTHIPDIVFRGYKPETLSDGFAVTFFAWVGAESLLMMLIPVDHDDES